MAAIKYPIEGGQLKFAEKLIILNNRAIGMLTRIYNMKKACADVKSKPQFLNEKFLESLISHILKRFPAVDLKRNSSTFACIDEIKGEIIKNLSLYYYTLSDLLDLKDAVLQLLTTMDANQCRLSIEINFDLTTAYLNLVVNFISLMVMLSRIEDRKIVLGLFNVAYDLIHSSCEPHFPRLGQMVIDYDNPYKKLAEDLGPLNRLIYTALQSLREVYFRRNVSAEQQRESQMFSLISTSKQMCYAAQTHSIACEYLSLDVMDRWIILGVTLCHKVLLNDSIVCEMYYRALQNGISIRLFRDESVLIFPMILQLFEPIKQYNKVVNEIKELYFATLQTCAINHAHRRQFLRTALKELSVLLCDQPGLLGPKILFVWMGLSFARDEILWLLRHTELWPQVLQDSAIKKTFKRRFEHVTTDKFLPELIYYMIELSNLVTSHSETISRYYVDYVMLYDAPLLTEMVADSNILSSLSEHDTTLFCSCIEGLSRVSDSNIDLKAIRLDWFRFQANTSMQKCPFKLHDHLKFTVSLNTAIFHLRQIDELDDMLRETSDLGIYCFYSNLFDTHLKQCLHLPIQSRYSISFAQVATHFTHSIHEMCPEELECIIEQGLISCNATLEGISQRVSDVLIGLNDDELELSEAVSPYGCAKVMAFAYQRQSTGKHQRNQHIDIKMPGQESLRNATAPLTQFDKSFLYLTELCNALAHFKEINICNHTFFPREFLVQNLERNFLSNITNFARSTEIRDLTLRRPSEVLNFINVAVKNLHMIETYVPFDIARLMNDTILQQSQPLDSHNNETLTTIYSKWYLEVLLRRKDVIYSDHFREFTNNSESPNAQNFKVGAEHYTDKNELKALAQLIGPLGIKYIEEKLVWSVASQVADLFKIVNEQKDLLHIARINYDRPEKIREIVFQLSQHLDSSDSHSKDHRKSAAASLNSNSIYASPNNSIASTSGSTLDMVIQKIITIGEIIAFRDLVLGALNDAMKIRASFTLNTLNLLTHNSLDEMQRICAACGIKADHIDLALVNAIQKQSKAIGLSEADSHYNIACLLLVFIAIAMPKLASFKHSFFQASLVATQNNCHVIPLAVNSIAGALFFLHRRGDLQERMREFLALASSALLQIVGTPDNDSLHDHQSLYILMERVIRSSSTLNFGLLESCFPYTLIRSAYLFAYIQEGNNDTCLGFGYTQSDSKKKN